MRELRKFLRFWFGLTALSFVGGIISLVLPIAQAPEDFSRGHVVAMVIVLAVLDAFPAVAWWRLKKARPNARIWALLASAVLMAPLFLRTVRHTRYSAFSNLSTLLGVTGLIAFWPKDSAADAADGPAPKKVRIQGDGTSNLKDYVAQVLSFAMIWIGYRMWNLWAAFYGLENAPLIVYLAQFVIALLLSTLFHELGHLVAGWASGKILRLFQVGPFRWMVRNGKWKFEFNLRTGSGGACAMVAPDLRNLRSRTAFMIMGGPVASLLAGSILTALTLAAPGHAWASYWSLLSMMATFCLTDFAVNLIPLKPESNYSDGAQLYQIVNKGPWACVHLAFNMAAAGAVSRVRPRDYDVTLINKAADFVPQGVRGLLLRLFASLHYLDTGEISKAIASLQQAEGLYDQCKFNKPQDVCAEFVFVNAFHKRDLAAAEFWWQKIEALPKVDPDADYWRARASILWLRGDLVEAREAWEKGDALAQKLPSCGAYDFTRSCFAELRAALDAPLKTTPPPLESLTALAGACELLPVEA